MAKKSKTKSKKPAVQKTTEKGYKGHNAGSRKGPVHEVFDKKGPEAALEFGLKLTLKESTLKAWFGVWTRAKGAKKQAA